MMKYFSLNNIFTGRYFEEKVGQDTDKIDKRIYKNSEYIRNFIKNKGISEISEKYW